VRVGRVGREGVLLADFIDDCLFLFLDDARLFADDSGCGRALLTTGARKETGNGGSKQGGQ
jgi:hypothetical protein